MLPLHSLLISWIIALSSWFVTLFNRLLLRQVFGGIGKRVLNKHVVFAPSAINSTQLKPSRANVKVTRTYKRNCQNIMKSRCTNLKLEIDYLYFILTCCVLKFGSTRKIMGKQDLQRKVSLWLWWEFLFWYLVKLLQFNGCNGNFCWMTLKLLLQWPFIYSPIFFIENDRFCNKPTSNQFYYVECSHWHVQEKKIFFIKFDILN